MLRTASRFGRVMAPAAAMLVALAPVIAQADDDERAMAALAAAKAKVDSIAQSGEHRATEIEARAKAALERAEKERRDGDEDRTRHAANEAGAYAELALATSELRAAEAQRDKLRATTSPQTTTR